LSPNTSASQSSAISASLSFAAATLWKALTTRTPSPSRCCAAATADPSGGDCTHTTRGDISGTVVSMSSFPASAGPEGAAACSHG
jgi:hypothetical protein